ncbi:cobaltochelatase subunit CobN [Methanothermobacter thermautotrophicus]|uniref:cobaltochelatase subunit CobN n=1 Tax=Methanothermobacter thermautotrophicus TaxID=145262 RepID=UPI0022B942D7|nr:cobaltochelatase subunit CobN [Methanothermobacter thermautotrophicus]WBF08407.1 cobaltochelatase subunit CobN [Methanothermobacter thermautotrophicus]
MNSVAAADDSVTIQGTILNNTTPAPNTVVLVMNPTDNTTLASSIADDDGKFNVTLQTNLTRLLVEMNYAGQIYRTTITPTGSPRTAELNHRFGVPLIKGPLKMLILTTGISGFEGLMNSAYKEMLSEGYMFQLKLIPADRLYENSTFENFKRELADTQVLFFFFSSMNPDLVSVITPVLQNSTARMYANYNFRVSGANITILSAEYSTVAPGYTILALLNNENMKKILLEVLRLSGYAEVSRDETRIINGNPTTTTIPDFAFHPATPQVFHDRASYLNWYLSSGHYKSGGPWVGIVMHSWHYTAGQLEPYRMLIDALERRGCNVIPISSHVSTTRKNTTLSFFTENNTTAIDLIIPILVNAYGYTVNESYEIFKMLNVPALSPVFTTDVTIEEYLENPLNPDYSVDISRWYLAAEIDGRIEPIFIGGFSYSTDPDTGLLVRTLRGYSYGIDQLADRTVSWIRLRREPSMNKRIAIVYSDSAHDETVPIADGLNVIESLVNILGILRDNGYSTGNTTINSETLISMIRGSGRNGNYTSAQLKVLIENGAVTLPLTEYLRWYSKLPASLRRQVETLWGPAPGNFMVYNGSIVLPGFILGNVFIGPQPPWKWNGTLDLNNGTLPPTHQYIAFYIWLQHVFRADACIQLGTHGTLEMLPGRRCGMTEYDWPNTLIGSIPYIYIYRMDSFGETDLAKRRSYAVIISHLIPPVVSTELYGFYAELRDLLVAYRTAQGSNDTARMGELRNQIIRCVSSNDILKTRIRTDVDFECLLDELSSYLEMLSGTLTSEGLHTFGRLPENETIEKFISGMMAYDQNRTREALRSLIEKSVQEEVSSLLNVLNGGYIVARVGRDPVRSLDSMPSGANIYSFDPRRVPDAAAYSIGGRIVNETLRVFLNSSGGCYPETIAIPVSASEIMVTSGQSLGVIFNLLGVRPVYMSGVLVDTEVIPLSELGRPRIDVMIQAAVNFRDLCLYPLEIVDDAIRKIAKLNEPSEMNYIRKHYLALKPEITTLLRLQGLSEEDSNSKAELLSSSRIFSLPLSADTHAVSLGRMILYSDSWDVELLASTYLDYYTFIYGRNIEGIPGRILAERLIGTVNTTLSVSYHTHPGRTYYTGSVTLNFIVRYLTGRNITSYIASASQGRVNVKTLSETLNDDITLTILNPQWRDSMLREGYSGRNTIALFIRNLYVSDVLVKAVHPSIWISLRDIYFRDKSIWNQFDQEQKEIISRALYSVYTRNMITLEHDEVNQLKEILRISDDTGGSDPSVPGSGGSNPTHEPGHGSVPSPVQGAQHGNYESAHVSSPGKQSTNYEAQKGSESDYSGAYEVKTTKKKKVGSDNMLIYSIAGTVLVVSLLGAGYYLKR